LKLLRRSIPFLFILLFGVTLPTHAQDSNVSVAFGLGTAGDTSSGQCISNFGESSGNCFNADADAFGFRAPKLTGLLGKFGADFMLNKHVGIGGEYAFRWSQGNSGDVRYRPNFYDFNVLFHPVASMGENSKIVPELQAGLGGVQLKFYQPSQCDQLTCSGSQFVESANHFQVHGAVGVKIYVKGGLFLRPQVDIHWVSNFNQFGSAWVPEGTIAIGYTLGSH
jgi:hypothetical protein